ncbi:hypothetical protein FIBSPDRAFT_957028 [Athelia psychrophila]|uniref:BAH-domain-containing protein n=1 Tax=Athelia psychrophila TaxID=1759441 RepID=A0A166G8E4_9AGAM|nr:hypothetical protein FIBSPDRAFT_957028 [Fibularhizoctonia sp. CBS 109695]
MAVNITLALRNKDLVKVNDHVYCCPRWSQRDGTPYSVARIMEFLPPAGTETGKGKGKETYTRARLAWYYRPTDVSDRPNPDSRLLLAAIYSEIADLSQLRAKCHVIHRDKITDLSGWKKRPDRFYFNRLFDPYIKKEFEVIQSSDVRNLPQHIKEVLCSRYEYVVTEKEVVPDLTDNIRLCGHCEEWCPTPETVKCDRCKNHFHMACVQPPLLAKPARGYGWTCAPCSRRHEQEVDSHEVRPVTPTAKPKSNAPAARGRGRPRKDRGQAEREESIEVKHFKMWPFRYFGQHTIAEDTLDPDDLINPRTASRIGIKFQANVANGPTETAETIGPEERGGPSTVEAMSLINQMTEQEVTELEECKDALTDNQDLQSAVDWLTEVIHRFTDSYVKGSPPATVNMDVLMHGEKWKKYESRYTDRQWTLQEMAAFDDGILIHNAELRAIRDEIGTRTMPEVVRYYGHWKNAKLRERNKKPLGDMVYPTREEIKKRGASLSDDEGSIDLRPTRANPACAACRAKESKTWWKAPKGLTTNILCDNCGLNWRKYADLNVRPQREESLPNGKAKREGTPLAASATKRSKTISSSLQSTPPPSNAPQIRCQACSKNGPLGKVLECKQCHFKIHAAAAGAVVEPSAVESWVCDLCQNEDSLEASLNSDCLLCPRVRGDRKAQKILPSPDSFLRACKPTEGQGWVHVLCSVFMPEVSFTDAACLRLAEGISTIPRQRWLTSCSICNEAGGAVTKCSDCVKEYHASCAWKAGHRFGFELQPVKNSRRDITTITTFLGESGSMQPLICCKEHNTTRHTIYDLCSTNEMGESALQHYCRLYKQEKVAQAHALLRKARRLDLVQGVRGDGTLSPPDEPLVPDRRCHQCQTMFSPAFYELAPTSSPFIAQGDATAWLCHKCHFTTAPLVPAVEPAISEPMVAEPMIMT